MIHITFTDGSSPYILKNESLLYKWFYKYDVRLIKIADGALFFVAATEKARRRTYQQAKDAARQFAINIQDIISGEALSYGFLADVQFTLYYLGRHFGLVREFKENCIC